MSDLSQADKARALGLMKHLYDYFDCEPGEDGEILHVVREAFQSVRKEAVKEELDRLRIENAALIETIRGLRNTSGEKRVWHSKPPTKPGRYWYKRDEKASPELVSVDAYEIQRSFVVDGYWRKGSQWAPFTPPAHGELAR